MTLVTALSAAALLLAGCGSSGEEQQNQSDQSSQQDDSTSTSGGDSDNSGSEQSDESKTSDKDKSEEDTKSDEQADSSAPDEATKPGTTLTFGEQAVLPIEKDDKKHLVGVTVTGIEKGDEKAFSEALGDNAPEGVKPYYIKYTVENLDGADLSYTSPPRLSGMLEGGKRNPNIISGSLPDCEAGSMPEDFTKSGATYEACELDGATDQAVAEAHFDEHDTKYEDNPVVWKK